MKKHVVSKAEPFKIKILLLLFISIHSFCAAQEDTIVINTIPTANGIDENNIEIINKIYSKEFQKPSFTALNYYPELAATRIKFIEKKINSYMQAQPTIGSIFRKKRNREYRIFIHPEISKVVLFLNSEKVFMAYTGAIAHELGHILYYEQHNGLHLFVLAFRYPFICFRKNFERNTDITAIAHGLGSELYLFKQTAFEHTANTKRLKRMKKYYLSPDETLEKTRR